MTTAAANNKAELSSAERVSLFREMLRIRRLEERIVERYPEQEMRCPVHLSIGQEAPAVGACAALRPGDAAMSTHRSHAHYLAKGGNMRSMVAELYGRITGCSVVKGGSMHFVDVAAGFLGATPIVGATIPIAVGTALGFQQRGESKVTAIFFGEGATEEGAFHEAINFASLMKLPCVFFCENNFFSVYSPLRVRQPEGRPVYRVAEGHGVEGIQANGNDIETVVGLSRYAVNKARRGDGPTFLEFQTYRWREHCGPNFDNDIGYRTEEEYESWRKRCPVENNLKRLLEENLLDEPAVAKMESEIKAEVDDAFRFAKESPYPGPEELLRHVYPEPS